MRLLLALTMMAATGLATLPAVAGGVAHPRDAADVFVKATAAGDADTIAALYAPNAVFLVPNRPVISGRDAIRQIFVNNFASGPNAIRFLDVKVDGAGDRALVLWLWVSEIKPKSGKPVRTVGRSMVYMVRGESGWQISADMMQDAPKP
jgi:uncharacterized protein (TIGR02246 family)